MQNVAFNSNKPMTLLCIGAHCDDIEIGAGGTIFRLIDSYNISFVYWVVFSSNEVREVEALKSARLFLEGVQNKKIVINSWRDGYLPFFATELKDYFEGINRKVAPDIIFTHYRHDRHQDHRFLSDLTWNTWRNHLILEYEIPKYDGDIGNPGFFVELDENTIAKKNRIILESYQSQSGKHWFDDHTFRVLPRLRGLESATKYAEAFYTRKIIL